MPPDSETSTTQGQQHLEELIEFLPDIVLLIARGDTRILGANAAALSAYGYSREELLSLTIRELRAPETQDAIAGQVTLADAAGTRFETVHRRKNGTTFSVEVSSRGATLGGERILLSVVRDITERVRAEAAYREMSERLRLANKATREVIWDWDIVADAQLWNESGTEVFGWTDIVTQPQTAAWWMERVHPDDRDRVDRNFFAVVNNPAQDRWQDEYRFQKADGSWAEVLDRGYVLRDDRGTAVRMIGSMLDVTERVRAEDALKVSEEKYRLLHEAAGVGIAYYTRDGIVVSYNNIASQYMGGTPETFVGKSVYDLFPAAEADLYISRIRKAAESPNRQEYEDLVELPTAVMWFQSVFTRVVDSHQNVVGVQIVSTDITARVRAEEALRMSEERFRALVERSGAAMTVIDAQGKILYESPNVPQVTGHEITDRLGRSAFETVHPDDRQKVKETFVSVVAGGEGTVKSLEFRALRADGTLWWVEGTAVNWINDPSVKGIIVNYRDVGERKQAEAEKAKLEEQLHHAQKMESIGRLAGGVAHDFNNMLSIIQMSAQHAIETVDPSLSLYDDLADIGTAAARSADLTRQLLAFARRQTIAPRVLDLNESIEGLLKMLRRILGENLTLSWHPASGLWPVFVDPSQVDQILANLCVNARDAIADIGTVSIETSNRSIDENFCTSNPGFVPGDYVQVCMSDNGCGMDAETQKHIFEPFFTTKGEGKGTGLGLATVYGIVRQNNGFVNVTSAPQQGTMFTIYLPRHLSKAAQVPAERARPVRSGRETILVVEDESAILRLITRLLEELGYSVLATRTPGEAIRVAREHVGDIHLLLSDVVMPEMNGRDLAKNVLSLYPGVRCLFMSGYTADIIAHHGVLETGVSFIQKPFSAEDLSAKIREVLEHAQGS
jgi:two-component system cell cycle sensor histidine kinase/response regulator CckA